MMPLDEVFPEIARDEYRSIIADGRHGLPRGTYVLREFYCNDRDCDCRRVLLHVVHMERERIAATINYGFEPSKPPFADEPQVFLDPLNPQSEDAEAIKDLFEEVIAVDEVYRRRLVRHYELWKDAVDDPRHSRHAAIRGKTHDDPDFRPAFSRQEPVRRAGPRVGPNDPCPCGSGKKHKRCCRQ